MYQPLRWGILTIPVGIARHYTRDTVSSMTSKIDIMDKAYVGRVWLYIFCGLLDAMGQTTVYWLMGAMSENPATLAHFVGICKSSQLWNFILKRIVRPVLQTREYNRLVQRVYGELMV